MQSDLLKNEQVFPAGQTVNAATYSHSSGYPEVEGGKHQPKKCNDVFWGILFYAHVVTMIVLAATYAPQMEFNFNQAGNNYNDDGNNYYNYNDDADDNANDNNNAGGNDDGNNNNDDDPYYRKLIDDSHQMSITHIAMGIITRTLVKVTTAAGVQATSLGDRFLEEEGNPNAVLLLVGLTIIGAFVLSILSLALMIRFADGLIKSSLFFNMSLGLITAAGGFMAGSIEAGIMGLVVFAIAACYAWAVWSRIPFAATNLVTASTAVQANMGLTIFAYVAILVNGLWLVLWFSSAYSTLFILGGCDANGDCENNLPGIYSFLFTLSLYWTAQVIKNVVHVTVAGTVGTWWWTPMEASGFCSKAVRESHNRAMTHSFGSICLGSLLVAIIQTIRTLLENARESDDGFMMCIADCILGCLVTIMEMFNEWAFVYVGLYGYGFVDAAKNVITLFKSRGWTAIITDYMVDRVLLMISFGNGLIAGGFAAAISYMFSLNLEGVAFFVGFFVGMLLSTVVLSVVGSGVNTVIVCYAEDPATFEINHYSLSMRMRDAWRSAFPNDFTY